MYDKIHYKLKKKEKKKKTKIPKNNNNNNNKKEKHCKCVLGDFYDGKTVKIFKNFQD